jgi:hypothetical protein
MAFWRILYCSRDRKAFEFPIASVAKKIIAEKELRKDRCLAISAADTGAAAFGATLRDHVVG